MFLPDLVIRSRRVVTRTGVAPAAVHVRGGRIIGVLDFDNVPDGCPVDDAGDLVVMPGIVDTHVHVNASTAADSEAFEQTTRAAAAGGVTTIVDLGCAGRPTASLAALEQKRRAAAGHCAVDVGFCGRVAAGNGRELAPLAGAGVFSFACTFGVSAVENGEAVTEADLRTAMPALARIGATLMINGERRMETAESAEIANKDRRNPLRSLRSLRSLRFLHRGSKYASFLETHPKKAETDAILRILEFCREYRTRTHILNLSSSDALTPIFRARAAGLPVTAETCPHYLHFVSEEVPDGATALKCVPPIRERLNRELLWGALSGGLIQMVASDHSPPPAGFHRAGSRDFSRAWGGIASLPWSLPAVWTVASSRGHTVGQLAGWMCHAPARIAGIERKGEIDVGYDADFVVWNPEAEFTVDDAGHAANPYARCRLRGAVARVYLRGTPIHQQGRTPERAIGHLLAKERVSTVRV